MKPRLDANVAASAGISGSTPVARASAITTGTTMFALATLLVNSLVTTATTVATATSTGPLQSPAGIHPVIDWPMAPASPVEKQSSPSAMPPPYKSTMSQSMRASRHSSARRRWPSPSRFPGKRKSRMAPTSATTPSGSRFESQPQMGWDSPRRMSNTPGNTHRKTVRAKAIATDFCPTVQAPRRLRSAAT